MEGFEVLVAILTVLAALLLLISILAYKREGSWRLIIVAIVFAIFLIKGIIMTVSIFTPDLEDLPDELGFHLIFDVIILLFLFFALLSPPKSGKKKDLGSKETSNKKI